MSKKRSKNKRQESREGTPSAEGDGTISVPHSDKTEPDEFPQEDSDTDAEVELPELDELRVKYEKLSESHLRLQADFDNVRKRAQREREDAYNYGHETLVSALLGTVDNLERAIEHAGSGNGVDFSAILKGVELVQEELFATLERHGVAVIEAQGQPFDPAEHEAMAQHEDDSLPPNTVVRVFAKGYRLRDRLLRPAKVVVSKPSGAAELVTDASSELDRDDSDSEGDAESGS